MSRSTSPEWPQAAGRRIWGQSVWSRVHQCACLCQAAARQRVPPTEPSTGCFHNERSLRLIHGHLLQPPIPGGLSSFDAGFFSCPQDRDKRVSAVVSVEVVKHCMSYNVHSSEQIGLACFLQIIAGVIEERGIEAFLGNNPRLCNILSFAVRTGNTYLGSLMW